MLQSIRDRAQGIIIWTIVGLIILSFALWGVEGYFGGGSGEGYVARVDGVEIDPVQLQRAHQNRLDELQRMLGEAYRPGMFNEAALKRQALEGLINRAVMLQLLDDAGFTASPEQIRGTIQAMPAFQGEEGRFSMARYEQLLSFQGMSPDQFEREVARDIASEQLFSGIVQTAFATPEEVARYQALLSQTRDVGVLTLSAQAFLDAVKVEDAEVRAVYDSNPARFMTPEKVSIEYLDLSLDALARDIQVSEAQARQYYEEHRDRFMSPEQRRARHILVTVGAERSEEAAAREIESLREQLQAGASFEELARRHSEDPGSREQGGDLGLFARGVMDAAFEEAAFALEPGQVSAPVRSAYGYHLIRVEAVEPGQGKPFEQVREEILRELRLQEAEPQFYEALDRAANLSYEHPESLEMAAEELGLQLRTTEPFGRQGGQGIAAQPEVVAAAFGAEVLEDRVNSEPVEIAPNRYVILRVREHQPAQAQPFEAVQAQIRQDLRRQAARERAMQAAREAAERLRAGTPGADLTEGAAKWRRVESLSRRGAQQEPLPAAVRELAFELPRPVAKAPSVETLALPSGDAAVVVLYGVGQGDAQDAAGQDEALAGVLGQSDFSTVVQQARDNAEVRVNEGAL